MKKTIYVILICLFALTIFSSGAGASMMISAADQAKNKAQAPEHSPVINENWALDRIDFIHYAKPSGPTKPSRTETCYKLMGVKWISLPVSYAINPVNTQGLSVDFIASAISTGAETWDAATSAELFNDNYSLNETVQYGIQDYKNTIAFGPYDNANVIAITSVWYTRIGKRIVEFDMLFNTGFAWGDADINPDLMDLENIATHELGHAVGLADIYNTSCASVTMYGYSTEGDLAKRTLEPADITGLRQMYGL